MADESRLDRELQELAGVAQGDQSTTALSNLARMTGGCFNALLAQGLTRDEALTLTREHMALAMTRGLDKGGEG